MQIVSPYVPFPSVRWWQDAVRSDKVWLDGYEHFVKATERNRYRIATANGLLQLSVPLAGGRGQRTAMRDVVIDNSVSWQEQHWRSIFSAYGRAPYYEYYSHELGQLFKKEYTKLAVFCRDSIEWLARVAGINVSITETDRYLESYGDDVTDWRSSKNNEPRVDENKMPKYRQVFEDRHGFLPNLSLLDMLMNEGPVVRGRLVGSYS